MISNEVVKETLNRMKDIRGRLIKEYPFYGELALHLELGVAQIGTATTDMKHLVVDPAFAARLSDEELFFVFMHEILHCVLFHCVRGEGKDPYRWNVACDIVVNSNALNSLGFIEMVVDGEKVMHRVRDGREGFLFTAEEVYESLPKELSSLPDWRKGSNSSILDNHDFWKTCKLTVADSDRWDHVLLDTTRKWAGNGACVAWGAFRSLKEYAYQQQLNWKQICRDFVRRRDKGSDYSFRPPDRRFGEDEFIYPGLNPVEEEVIEDILFCVDKSGSISVEAILSVMKEIECALKQINGLSGKLLFFDMEVTKPITFSNGKELLKQGVPMPSGGTDFHVIFEYVREEMIRNLPKGIIILTDGYADFPSQAEAKNIPTLWVIVDSRQTPKWGKCVHINSRNLKPFRVN